VENENWWRSIHSCTNYCLKIYVYNYQYIYSYVLMQQTRLESSCVGEKVQNKNFPHQKLLNLNPPVTPLYIKKILNHQFFPHSHIALFTHISSLLSSTNMRINFFHYTFTCSRIDISAHKILPFEGTTPSQNWNSWGSLSPVKQM